jgi:hypothetical protein
MHGTTIKIQENSSAVEYASVLAMFMHIFQVSGNSNKSTHCLLQRDDENYSDSKLEKLRLFVEIETNRKLIK